MWSISVKTNIMHSLFISFKHALNQLPWISGLSDILVTINAILAHKSKQRCILQPVKHLRWSFLPYQLTAERFLFSIRAPSQIFTRCCIKEIRAQFSRLSANLVFLPIFCFIYTKTFEARVIQVFLGLLDLHQMVSSKAYGTAQSSSQYVLRRLFNYLED